MANKNLKYYEQSYRDGDIEYGCMAAGEFYPGIKIDEGDSFTDDQFEYVGKMGSEWQKGHLLAKSLGGHNEGDNMLPMNRNFNDGIFKSFEHDIKKIIDNLTNIQKHLNNVPVFLGYKVQVIPTSVRTIKGFRIPTQIKCTVAICRQSDNSILLPTNLEPSFKVLELNHTVLGTQIFDVSK